VNGLVGDRHRARRSAGVRAGRRDARAPGRGRGPRPHAPARRAGGRMPGRGGRAPAGLKWVAADLGPGSFTGCGGTGTARGCRSCRTPVPRRLVVGGARDRGRARRSLLVPLVAAGRRDVYAGWFRAGSRGQVRVLAAPLVGTIESVLASRGRALAIVSAAAAVHRPAVAREPRTAGGRLRAAPGPRFAAGLSAHDLGAAVSSGLGPAAGLPAPDQAARATLRAPGQGPRSACATWVSGRVPTRVETVHAGGHPGGGRDRAPHVLGPLARELLRRRDHGGMAHARIAERGGDLAGLQRGLAGVRTGHLGNSGGYAGPSRATAVASVLLDDLPAAGPRPGRESLTLECACPTSRPVAVSQARLPIGRCCADVLS